MKEVILKAGAQIDSRTFVLKQTTLSILGEPGLERERTISLRSLSPEFRPVLRRFKRFYLGPIFLSLLSGAAAVHLFQNESMLGKAAAGVLAAVALGFCFVTRVAPVEGAEFKNREGAVEFCVFRPLRGAYVFDEFVDALVYRIKRASEVVEQRPNREGQSADR